MKNEYIVIAIEHVTVKGEQKHIITTSCLRDGHPVQIWVTDEWYKKNGFCILMSVSLSWNKEYKRFSGIFPVIDGVQN